jgi:hypothetical protein
MEALMNHVRMLMMTALMILTSACTNTGRAAPGGSAPSVAGAVTAPATPVNGRLSGTVQNANAGEVVLREGQSFALGPDAVVIRSIPVDAEAFQPGDFVAVTAKRQEDGTLLASIVNIFPESMRGMGEGQRPMDAGNIMTNATIDGIGPDLMTNATVAGVTSGRFTVSFPDGSDQVELAEDAHINQFEAADPADLVPGTAITASVNNGVAQFVTIVAG